MRRLVSRFLEVQVVLQFLDSFSLDQVQRHAEIELAPSFLLDFERRFLDHCLLFTAALCLPRVGFSNVGCSLYVTFSINDAGTSWPFGPTQTSLMDHFRIGKPSLAGGRSFRICCYNQSTWEALAYRLRNKLDGSFDLFVSIIESLPSIWRAGYMLSYTLLDILCQRKAVTISVVEGAVQSVGHI